MYSGINSMAKMVETLRSRIELDLILDLHAYDSTSRSIPSTPSHSSDGAHISNVSSLCCYDNYSVSNTFL